MPYLVADGAQLRCSMGTLPSLLMLQGRPYRTDGVPLAHVGDHEAIANIMPFGRCTSLANPEVNAYTTASGMLTPRPCHPPLFTMWTPGAAFIHQVLPDGRRLRALTSASTCACPYGGTVLITSPNTNMRVDDGSDGAHERNAAREDATSRAHEENAAARGDTSGGAHEQNAHRSPDGGTR